MTSSETNSNAFSSDYALIAECLFAIQASEENGLFNANAELLKRLRLFEQDVLKKLYVRTIRVLKIVHHGNSTTYIGGDFSAQNFSERDFNVGNPVIDPNAPENYLDGDFSEKNFSDKDFHVGYPIINPSAKEDYFYGDFEEEDFFYEDFHVGYLDTRNTGYSSIFQSILNMLNEINRQNQEGISDEDIYALNEALQAVLDAFKALREKLVQVELNPCNAANLTYQNNTSGVYLQVSGSDGTDGIAEGLHLRWSLTDDLGNNHLPKGEYYNTKNGVLSGFNRKDDYVHVVRTPYTGAQRFYINFEQSRPVISIIKFSTRQWTYTLNQNLHGHKITNRVKLFFNDVRAYDRLAKTLNPLWDFFRFLKAYTGIITIQVEDKSCFLIGFDFNKTGAEQAILKVEAEAQVSNNVDAENKNMVRKTIVLNGNNSVSDAVKAENINRIRVKKTINGYIQGFFFETYHDFLSTRNPSDWTAVGTGFGISLNDAEVLDRLENTDYPIDHLWPQYNDGTTVRVANYQDKWLNPQADTPSLKQILEHYLVLSDTDPRAEEIIRDRDSNDEDTGFSISYLDIVNLQALDYHMARMLGLGHIDTPENAGINDRFIYQLRYTNRKSLSSAENAAYVYTSLPVGKTDHLTPQKPSMRPIEYRFIGGDEQINDTINEQGYSKIDNVRVINIGRMPYSDELIGYNFFSDLNDIDNLNIFEQPKPVFYGLEYRAENQARYVKPEITDADFSDEKVYFAYDDEFPEGIQETVPLMDDVISLYTHFEKENGRHFYAIYGINWFSRASMLSDETSTDVTFFKPVNNLVPPTDVAVQYIQKENTLIFTTSKEQTWLEGRKQSFPGQDIGITRVTFNWLDTLDVSRLNQTSATELNALIKADYVKAYFNQKLPLEVIGSINDIILIPGAENLLKLITGSYKQMDGTVVSPVIAPGDLFRFANSMLATPNGKFRVDHMGIGDRGLEIVVERITDTKVVDDDNEPGVYSTQKFYVLPEIGSRFTLVENLSNPANWNTITGTVLLKSFADPDDPNIEVLTDPEENVTRYWIGGLHNQATITPLFGLGNAADDLLGYYKVNFDAQGILEPHPQANLPFDPNDVNKNSPGQLNLPHVEWYKGLLRVPALSGDPEPKLLEVIRIEQTHPLELYVFDPTYQEDPIQVSDQSNSRVSVNFHPGYRVYFFSEPGPDHVFNGTSILPQGNDNDKRTMLGLQTLDTRPEGNQSVSAISMPAILLARKIDEPLQFEAPMALGLKVRPDATGKAAFTFDVKIAPSANGTLRTPFGFMFYRTTNEDVLEALYAPETVDQILTDLAELTEDPFYSQRYVELVNLIFDPEHPGQFKVFEAAGGAYGFPQPDKSGLTAIGDGVEAKKAKYQNAIQETLLPLTEQTPMLSFIKQGFQTENALPVIRDLDGNLLDGAHAEFNPFPMIRQYKKPAEPNATYIRFTDYFLSGASRKLYFFAGVEMTNQLEPGLLSPFAGPVTILHTLPSAPPLVTKFSIHLDAFLSESGVSVTFNIASISPEDHITKIRVYRSKYEQDTLTLQGMDSYFETEIQHDEILGYEITDDFSNATTAPLGETIYYRLAGIRTVINEQEEAEEVLSLGTDVIAITLPDYRNPQAPDLSYDQTENKLSWLPTANLATYYVYKQNNRGNWEKVYAVAPPLSSTEMEYVLPEPLQSTDEDGDQLYYRFKVQVQNASGLFNLSDKEKLINI